MFHFYVISETTKKIKQSQIQSGKKCVYFFVHCLPLVPFTLATSIHNSLYAAHKLEMLYSNYIRFSNFTHVYQGISREYTQQQKKANMYRNESYTRVFHLRSFRVRNFLKIKASDLQTKDGVWFQSASDHAIYTPLLELSCGKSQYVEEYFYLYNDGNGNNDLDVDPEMNKFVNEYVRSQLPKYECDQN